MSKQDIEQQEQGISLDELIKQQHISPISNLDELSELWPVDDDPNLLMDYLLNERIERRRLDVESEQLG